MLGLMTQLTVIVVDDHRVIAEALALRMEDHPWFGEVRTARTLAAARTLLNTEVPDVVLLDFELEDECGLDLLPELNALPHPPITLVLSAHEAPEDIISALTAQAVGWLPKDISFEGLVSSIRAAMLGETVVVPRDVGPVIAQLLRESGRSAQPSSFVDDLSARELEVLRYLVQGLNRREVAQRLYLSTNTVRTHVQRLLQRSGEHSTLALVAAARAAGVTGLED